MEMTLEMINIKKENDHVCTDLLIHSLTLLAGWSWGHGWRLKCAQARPGMSAAVRLGVGLSSREVAWWAS